MSSGCSSSCTDENGLSVCTGVNPPYATDNLGTEPKLVNNARAKDPTWQQLYEFLQTDTTDEKTYIENVYACGSFAETLHNNAESAGIKAAFIAVSFSDDSVAHALNAFNTTDHGLVYIDDTGRGLQIPYIVQSRSADEVPWDHPCNDGGTDDGWDKVCFLNIGEDLGCIGLRPASAACDRNCYVQANESLNDYNHQMSTFAEDVEHYNTRVVSFNTAISGKTYYIGTSEERAISKIETELKNVDRDLNKRHDELCTIEESLVEVYEPYGIVQKIEVYW